MQLIEMMKNEETVDSDPIFEEEHKQGKPVVCLGHEYCYTLQRDLLNALINKLSRSKAAKTLKAGSSVNILEKPVMF